jgi:adenylosuccinate lyase
MFSTLSPLDNRYSHQVQSVANYFSYENWIKYRVRVELLYFDCLCDIPSLNINGNILRQTFLKSAFNINVNEICKIEKETLHDIKAIEIYLRNEYDRLSIGPPQYKEFIHFGLTSQDINSVAFSLQLKECIECVLIPKYSSIITILQHKSYEWYNIIIMAMTHGQPAIPTTLGKEIKVFIERLSYCLEKLKKFTYHTKLGGAVGTLAAHYKTYPNIDWVEKMDTLCRGIGLKRWNNTTQITNYEDIIEVSQIIIRLNNILMDLSQDVWLYISNTVFILKKETATQVGSSTMPQKVNPINFENAEGNLRIANAGLNMIVGKLPISRLQRDLTDSTILRNYGVYLGHTMVSLHNIEKGLCKLEPDTISIQNQLDAHPEIMAESVQCIFRKHGIPNGYDIVRLATQTYKFTNLQQFKEKMIDGISNTEAIKEIMALDFENYLGNIAQSVLPS